MMNSASSINWPPALQLGDVVAVAAPASPVAPEPFRAGVRWLQEWGFRVRYGKEIFQDRPYEAHADQERSRILAQLLADPEVKGVLCARGGYGSLKVLEYLDYPALAAHPKRFIGFSDVTTLLCTFYQRLNLVTFHGPTVAHLGELTPAARTSLRVALTANEPLNLHFTGLTVLCPGQAQGPLLGGNLTTLCHLIGTPFAPQLAGHVLFLEDHHEARYRIDRLLHHLRLSGLLQEVAAVVLGSFTRCGPVEPLLEIFGAALAPLRIPVLAGLPVGHQPDNHTLPIGAWAVVNTQTGSLRIEG